jgi:uncharacterized protein (DUF924 family)
VASFKWLIFPLTSLFFLFSHLEGRMDKKIDTEPKIEQILEFWFGKLENSESWDQDKHRLWFQGGAEFDRKIESLFKEDISTAEKGTYDHWKTSPRGRLALILLFDQFPRNIFRGTAKAFFYDSQARELALEGIQLGLDQLLYPIERQFFYLPLMHAEDPEIQNLSVQIFHQLKEEVPKSLKPYFTAVQGYANEHQKTIQTHGRFPYRDQALNRAQQVDGE